MVDFRVADTAPEHPKLRAAGLAAAGLWSLAGAFAMRELTDGWVPDYWVQSWPGGKRQAAALVAVGLWFREPRHGLPGYRYHDWADYQRTAESVERERAEARERARRNRESKKRSGERSPEYASGHPPDVQPKSHDSLSLSLSLALTPKGSGWEGTSGTEREATRNDPRPRCPQHAQLPPDQRIPACQACKQLRLEAEQQAADQAERAADERRDRRAAVAACRLCDDRGMREIGDALARCTHPALEAVS